MQQCGVTPHCCTVATLLYIYHTEACRRTVALWQHCCIYITLRHIVALLHCGNTVVYISHCDISSHRGECMWAGPTRARFARLVGIHMDRGTRPIC